MRPRRMLPALVIAMLAVTALAMFMVTLPTTPTPPPGNALASQEANPAVDAHAETGEAAYANNGAAGGRTNPQARTSDWPAFDTDPPADAFSQRFQSRLDADLRATLANDPAFEALQLQAVTCRATRCLVELSVGAEASSLTLTRLVVTGLVARGYPRAPFQFDAGTGRASYLVDMHHSEAPASVPIETVPQ